MEIGSAIRAPDLGAANMGLAPAVPKHQERIGAQETVELGRIRGDFETYIDNFYRRASGNLPPNPAGVVPAAEHPDASPEEIMQMAVTEYSTQREYATRWGGFRSRRNYCPYCGGSALVTSNDAPRA